MSGLSPQSVSTNKKNDAHHDNIEEDAKAPWFKAN